MIFFLSPFIDLLSAMIVLFITLDGRFQPVVVLDPTPIPLPDVGEGALLFVPLFVCSGGGVMRL